jgi:hypothetical protein
MYEVRPKKELTIENWTQSIVNIGYRWLENTDCRSPSCDISVTINSKFIVKTNIFFMFSGKYSTPTENNSKSIRSARFCRCFITYLLPDSLPIEVTRKWKTHVMQIQFMCVRSCRLIPRFIELEASNRSKFQPATTHLRCGGKGTSAR